MNKETLTAPLNQPAPAATKHSGVPQSSGESSVARRAQQRKASKLMAIGTLLSRLTGALRNIALVGFGGNALRDAYIGANTTPNMIYELVAGGVLSATLVPIFSQLVRKDTKRSRAGINAIVTLFGVVIVTASVVLALSAPLVMQLSMVGASNAAKRAVAVQLLRWFAPQVAIYGFVTIATALLNVHRRFLAPALAPVLNNIITIGVLLRCNQLLRSRSTPQSSFLEKVAHDGSLRMLMGLGTTAGVAAMALAMIPSMRASGVRLRWNWQPRHPAILEILRLSMWTLAYVACNQAALTYVNRLANNLQSGSASAYSLAYQTYFLLPHGLIAVSIATALQPHLAEAFLERRRGRFRREMVNGVKTQLILMIPASAAYFVMAGPILVLVRSSSKSDASLQTAILRSFLVGLPAFSLFLLLMNAFKAMRDTRTPFIINAVETLFNIALAVVFYRAGMGVPGLALAFALAYYGGSVIALVVLSRRMGGLHEREVVSVGIKALLASAVMAAGIWFAIREVALFGVARFGPKLASTTHLGSFAQLGIGTFVGVSVYAIVGRLLGLSELTSFVKRFARR